MASAEGVRQYFSFFDQLFHRSDFKSTNYVYPVSKIVCIISHNRSAGVNMNKKYLCKEANSTNETFFKKLCIVALSISGFHAFYIPSDNASHSAK